VPELIIDRDSGRFVSGQHYSVSTQIKRGERRSPETEIKPGQRLSPRTEFKAGQTAHNKMPIGSVTTRLVFGVRRAFVKVAEPNIWKPRAKVEWERANGRPLPRGHVVHHVDRNPLNDDPTNLMALTRAEHAREHLNEVRASGFSGEEARKRAQAARRKRP